LLWMRDQRTPVVAALPAVVVPGEIQNQRVEGNLALAEPRNLVLEVLLVVALEVGPPGLRAVGKVFEIEIGDPGAEDPARDHRDRAAELRDRKSTRLNSSHLVISYAVFCLKKKKKNKIYSITIKKVEYTIQSEFVIQHQTSIYKP